MYKIFDWHRYNRFFFAFVLLKIESESILTTSSRRLTPRLDGDCGTLPGALPGRLPPILLLPVPLPIDNSAER